ncbi:unnamed protein product, partial [Parnassius mnemosyne]
MYNKCCVPTCTSRRKDVSFHMLPKSEIGLKKWLQCINCERLRSLSSQKLRKHFVCHKHFEKRFLAITRERVRLCPNAYPTLFTVSEMSTGIPQTVARIAVETEKSNNDHNYCKKRQHLDHTYCIPEVVEKRFKASNTDNTETESDINSYQQPSTSTYESGTMEVPTADKNALHSPITRRKQHIIQTNKLSPHCAKLYRQYRKSQRQLNFKTRAKQAVKFSKEQSFVKLTEKLNPIAKKFLWMQIKECTKKARGRRFSDEEKLIAMAIMKQSPKCYRFLHRIFILPSKYTINKMIAKLNIEAGINFQIFDAIKTEVNTWDEKKKYCSILFDEVALEVAVSYDKHKDLISGFVELNKKTSDFADHALVFMLRGVVHKWQQPLAFYFCKGATSGVELKDIIKDMITAVGNTGLRPVALVCDQGTAFQSALKSLQEDTRREQIISGERIDDVIVINGHTLSVIHDPPHLIKGLRNNFLNKDIKYNEKISKWSDIVEVYKTDCNLAQMRLLHKLNDEHVIPEKIKKMKVKNCTRVFSKTVAAALSYTAQFSHYADGKQVSSTLKNTAEIISFFDDLFDSVNGTSYNKISKGKALRQAVTEKSSHHKFWREAILRLQSIKFIDDQGKETSVPSLKNWITTLKSYQRLWQYLSEKNIKFLRPRYLNSDPIENFFGQMRVYNFRNTNPNCQTFKSTFRSLLITRFIKFHSDSYNCEEDSGEQLLKLKSLFCTKEKSDNTKQIHLFESSELSSWVESESSAKQETINVHSRAYTAGWVIRNILKNNNCRQCEADLTNRESNYDKSSINNWIYLKEFKSIKEKKLIYPSEHAVRFFGIITQKANKYLETKPQQSYIIKNIKTLIKSKYLFDFINCELHKDAVSEHFLTLTLRLTVFNWRNVINKILKGTDVLRLENKALPQMQLKALNK